jgi:hypothetical protein
LFMWYACVCRALQGLGDVKPWASGFDAVAVGSQSIAGAQDECILHYVRMAGTGTRAVCLDKNNNGAVFAVAGWVSSPDGCAALSGPRVVCACCCGAVADLQCGSAVGEAKTIA